VRSDAAILGIMRSKAKKNQKRKDDLKKARKAIDKRRTIEMNRRRELKGTHYDMTEEEATQMAFDLAEFNVYNGLTSSDEEVVLIEESPSRHDLIMAANKLNKVAKKNRKLARRAEKKVELETMFKFKDGERDVALFEMVEVFDEIPIPTRPFDYYETSLMRAYGFKPSDDSDPFRCKWSLSSTPRVINWHNHDAYVHMDMTRYYELEIDPKEELKTAALPEIYEHYGFDTISCEDKEDSMYELLSAVKEGNGQNSYRFLHSLLDGYDDELAKALHDLLIQKGYKSFEDNTLYVLHSIDPDMNEPVVESFQARLISDLFGKLKEHSTLAKYTGEIEKVINFIIFLYLARRQHSLADRMMVFQLYLSTLGLSTKAKLLSHVLYAMAYKISCMFETPQSGKIELESFSDTLSDFSLYLKQIVSSNLVAAVRDFFVTAAALNFMQTHQVAYIHKYLAR